MLVTPSGGLVYHARALLYRETLWRPFRAALGAWLEGALPSGRCLILVGPSAGHCLPLRSLRRAERLLVLDPDPLARRWLAARLAGRRLEFEARDLLVTPLLEGRPGLEQVLARWPYATVLFCNVLGQLHFALSDEQQQRFQAEFRRRILPSLRGRAWASFHDRWSFDHLAQSFEFPGALRFETLPSDEQLASVYFPRAEQPVTVLDHGTSALFSAELPRHYFSWQITPRALHLVEAVGDVR